MTIDQAKEDILKTCAQNNSVYDFRKLITSIPNEYRIVYKKALAQLESEGLLKMRKNLTIYDQIKGPRIAPLSHIDNKIHGAAGRSVSQKVKKSFKIITAILTLISAIVTILAYFKIIPF